MMKMTDLQPSVASQELQGVLKMPWPQALVSAGMLMYLYLELELFSAHFLLDHILLISSEY